MYNDFWVLKRVFELISRELGLSGSIVDAGGAEGQRLRAAMEVFAEYFGFDPCKKFTKCFNDWLAPSLDRGGPYANKRVHPMLTGRIDEMEGADHHCVLLHHVLTHLGHMEAISALKQLLKMLVPLGTIVVKEPSWDCEQVVKWRGQVFRHLRPKHLWLKIFTAAGLTVWHHERS